MDKLLVEQGLFESWEKAQRSILAGCVRIGDDHVVHRSSEVYEESTNFRITEQSPFVSRGANKLEPVLNRYLPVLDGFTALDLGASTGGFTDLMLQRGVEKVYAVDVGYGQLHYRLRRDSRVECLEKVNARYLTTDQVPQEISILTADLSFISLTKVLPNIIQFLKLGCWIFVLIKPQFEAERHEIKKGGVVTSDKVRRRVVDEIRSFAECQLYWKAVEILPSPLKGPKGNQEYFGVFRSPG